jgi:hypothetical protein
MELRCAVCIYTKPGVANLAVTVKGGLAVCEDDMGYVRDDNINVIIALKKEQTRNGS